MIKRTAILMTTAFMFISLQGAAVADDRDQIRDQDRLQDQDPLQDGSCQYSTDISGKFDVAVDHIRDQKRDGSCEDDVPYSTDSVVPMMLSNNQYRNGKNQNKGNGNRDRLRDGSCLDYSTVEIPTVLS